MAWHTKFSKSVLLACVGEKQALKENQSRSCATQFIPDMKFDHLGEKEKLALCFNFSRSLFWSPLGRYCAKALPHLVPNGIGLRCFVKCGSVGREERERDIQSLFYEKTLSRNQISWSLSVSCRAMKQLSPIKYQL